MSLGDVLSASAISAIVKAKRITFHAAGDMGAAKRNDPSTEASVADMMVADVDGGGSVAPSFLFHLGDVVYNFGEAKYYYDQFYEPLRAYDRPIFAIPGNHDGMVFGATTDRPANTTLEAFLRNFCAARPTRSPDASTLVRSTMTQPGIYFCLDAPFVSIIGLYSNVLDGPGVISSQGGRYPISDEQLVFLTSELTRLKPQRAAGTRAIIIAIHHPPLSADAKHGGSTGASADIDACCRKAGLWPDAVLSGHAHLYQRFTRRIGGREIPYVVSGSGGFAATAPQQGLPKAPVTVGDHTLEKDPIVAFGYLTVTVDPNFLTIEFKSPQKGVAGDSVVVDLKSGTLKPEGSATPGPVRRKPKHR
jgi:3',5'-cyclic AMP phosphodiesterase CpdA